ncbi:SpoIIE family protein phosphatase [Coleofasciculus sp. FACHB-1120]|uniref:PP2C family protein-serine/threonine phosphatase n=1 Tax=Coleofasciculus sp. FACHB-1120 TaxID=2692783 RepID=UPI00168A3272|nr:SpoIIE family protein phosphatase [Coleofasciculus sp. FACHB-1120]MBD2744791.1 SpoIIE family protein phosphatase [Coleofasciculus sp. FACHB-1120]
MFKILIIDDDPTLRVALKRTLQTQGYDVTVASNGEEGIAQAKQIRPALIICDWLMPDLDGLEVCHRIKADPELETTFFMMLTAREADPGEEDSLIVGLNKGADDFLSKPINNKIEELKARVKAGLRLHLLNQKLQALNHDLQTQKQVLQVLNQNLQTQKQILEAELTEAADYVRSLLPSPLTGTVTTEAIYRPCTQLGGDCFDYYWLDDNHLALYLLDVSGHGVGSALLSVSILNVLRSQSLPNTNFHQPSAVLKALNNSFQMSDHGEKYFTIWYGVYNRLKRQIAYTTAGHPPAVLLSRTSTKTLQVKQLGFSGLPIGILPDEDFEEKYSDIEENSTLYIFSDGAYEIQQFDGKIWGNRALIEVLTDCHQTDDSNVYQVLHEIQRATCTDIFEDDLSLLKVYFS